MNDSGVAMGKLGGMIILQILADSLVLNGTISLYVRRISMK